MVNRREFLGMAAGAGAALALAPALLRAHQQSAGTLMRRAIPSSGEMLPVVSFGAAQESDTAAMKELLKTVFDNGAKVVNGLHGGGEQNARTAATELGMQDKFFWTTSLIGAPPRPPGAPPPPKAEAAVVRAQIETKLATYKVPRIDLVMAGAYAAANDPTYLGVLREMKKEGRVRYIGVHHLASSPNTPRPPFADLEAVMRNEQIDFIATDYSAGDRRAEETLLPLALERKIAFMAHFTFDRGRLFKRVGSTPLPEWAAEFDARTWPQFFVKYVLSHPAVIVARTGTTNPAHMLENIGGGIGRLPNEAMRKRMAQLVDSLPPNPPPGAPQPPPGPGVVLSAALLDRYAGEYQSKAGAIVTFRRDGDKLLVKRGNDPEAPLTAWTETRFKDPRGPLFEFQLDGQGTVTSAVMELFSPNGSMLTRLMRK
jgi:aryl-alcohol dehydrogenase-like predicted oxidoreductase